MNELRRGCPGVCVCVCMCMCVCVFACDHFRLSHHRIFLPLLPHCISFYLIVSHCISVYTLVVSLSSPCIQVCQDLDDPRIHHHRHGTALQDELQQGKGRWTTQWTIHFKNSKSIIIGKYERLYLSAEYSNIHTLTFG